jgi:hypothetical protein
MKIRMKQLGSYGRIFMKLRMEQFDSHGRIFMKFDIWIFFGKLSIKFEFHYNMSRIKATSHEEQFTFMTISGWILLKMQNVSDKNCRENHNTNFTLKTFLRNSCRLWDHVEKYCTSRQATDDNTLRRMRFTCWTSKARDTQSEYVTRIAFPQKEWSQNASHCYVILYLLTYSMEQSPSWEANQ